MAQKHRATALLRDNRSIPEIASELHIGISSVMQYLYLQVVEGALRRSDILFSIPVSDRQAIEDAIQQTGINHYSSALEKTLDNNGYLIPREIVQIYLDLRDARISMGDMYEFISEIEIMLHDFVKQTLIDEFGPALDGWWRKGIPQNIRKACAATLEEDPEPAVESFCYTNFIHLQEIIDKHWSVFSLVIPPDIVKEKKGFLNDFVKLNHIRNSIMHPVKRIQITEKDFQFVRLFHINIEILVLMQSIKDHV